MIKINAVTIPTPTDYSVGIMDIVKAERNARGEMIIERITTKRKIEISYSFISQADLSTVLNAISAVFFTVEYIDTKDGIKTGTFYAGDKNASSIDYRAGVMRWKDYKVNLIEK